MVVRLTKEPRPACGRYTLDAFAVELFDVPARLDFRFELGLDLGIFHAVTSGRLEPLRLLHVDGAAYHVAEPELVEEPWRADVPTLEWTGELGRLGNGDSLVSVRVEVRASPASYRVELVTRSPGGREHTTVLAWREPPEELRALPPLERADALDTLLRRMAREEVLDIAGVGMVHVEAGELMDRSFLDGAQYAAVTALRDAAVRGDLDGLRSALGHGLSGVHERPAEPARDPSSRTAGAACARAAPPILCAGPAVRGHRAAVGAAAFSPRGASLLTGDEQGRLVLHARSDAGASFEPRARAETSAGARRAVRGLAWAARSGVVAAQEGATVRLRDASTLAVRVERPLLGAGPLAWGLGDAWLAVAGAHGVRVLDGGSLADREQAAAGGDVAGATVTAFAVDAATGRVAAADDGGLDETPLGAPLRRGAPGVHLVTVGDPASRARVLDGELVRALAFDPWRRALVAATFDRRLIWWTGADAPRRVEVPFAPFDVRALAITERWLVLAPDRSPREATLELYDAQRFAHVASVPVPSGLSPDWIAASPDGRALATPEPPADRDFGVRLWFVGELAS